EFEAFQPQSLPRVGRSPRLERAASQDRRTRITQALRYTEDLLLRLDGARAGHDDDLVPTDPRPVRQFDDGGFGLPFPGDLLVGLGDVDHPQHARQRLQPAAVDLAVVAHEPDRGPLLSGHRPGFVPQLFDDLHDAPDLFPARVVPHDDQHSPNEPKETLPWPFPQPATNVRPARSSVQTGHDAFRAPDAGRPATRGPGPRTRLRGQARGRAPGRGPGRRAS